MSGLYTPGLPVGGPFTGSETFPYDANASGGVGPETAAVSMQQLALALAYFSNFSSKTTVAGTIYYGSYTIGSSAQSVTRLLTGISVLVGATGGTDTWIAGLYNSAGVLVASSTLAGTTAGTAGRWQNLAFTTAYSAAPGQYFIALQSNGTTATPAVLNAPVNAGVISGSQTGSAGTMATISAVSTTYTAALAPVALPYT